MVQEEGNSLREEIAARLGRAFFHCDECSKRCSASHAYSVVELYLGELTGADLLMCSAECAQKAWGYQSSKQGRSYHYVIWSAEANAVR